MIKNKKDKGAVLLTTLLIMSLMSAVAVAMMDEIRVAILRSGNMKAHAQAEWHLKAAESFAQSYVEENFVPLSAVEKNVALRRPIESALEIDGGIMALTIMDGSQCLPLSNLSETREENDPDEGDDGEGSEAQQGLAEALTNLMEDLGMPQLEATAIVAALQDWQDEDEQISNSGAEDYTYLAMDPAYRTPNAPMNSIGELRAIRGMNEEIFKLLKPYVCTGDAERTGAININTLQPYHLPLLAALLGPDEENNAAQILQTRPVEGYKDLTEDLAESGIDLARVQDSFFIYEPGYLWIEVDVTFGPARRTVLLEFKVDSNGLSRTYRHYGTEGRRPRPEDFEPKREQDQL